jgi:purine-binding chemotaxis protein CheW
MAAQSREMPWVIAQIGAQAFALPTSAVQEIVVLPEVAPVPDVPECIRGILTLRGRAFSVLDGRLRLGLPSLAAEYDALNTVLVAREEDHRRWLTELEASVRENRKFGLATDPTKCAFGKWLASYHTDNAIVARCLRSFDGPHGAIHALAERALGHAAAGQQAEALAEIEMTRSTTLAAVVRLFANLRQALAESRREVGLVVRTDSHSYIAAVDGVLGIERLSSDDINPLCPELFSGSLVARVARRPGGGDALLLPPDELLPRNQPATSLNS